MKKTLFPALFAVMAALAAGCQNQPENPHETTVDGGASAWMDQRPGGADAAWKATSRGSPDETWEGYPDVLSRHRTYEATIEGWKRVRLGDMNPAFRRFAKGGSSGDGVDVRIVDLRFTLRRGDARTEVVIPTFFPLNEFIEAGQTVLVRPVGEDKFGFLQVSVAGRTRYTEGYPSAFTPNRNYLGKISRVSTHWIDAGDTAYPRLLDALPRRSRHSTSERIEVQIVTLLVMTDNTQKMATVAMSTSPVYHAGDVVWYRTFGNQITGFADILIKERAATGSVARTRAPESE
jgi:hypothetical protein